MSDSPDKKRTSRKISSPPASFNLEPIGVIETCFKEKFGIPRQPGLVKSAEGLIKLNPHPFFKRAARGLETFSHLWVTFIFHQHDAKNWKPSIRPPRLGGAEKIGVLASRSPHRPNSIGLSAVKLDRIDFDHEGGVRIYVSGVDILDGTPVLDIKPYLPYADSIPEATSGWAKEEIRRIAVFFSDEANAAIKLRSARDDRPNLKRLIEELLSLDPRPASQKTKAPSESPQAQNTHYGFDLFTYDVKWEIRDGTFHVSDVVDV